MTIYAARSSRRPLSDISNQIPLRECVEKPSLPIVEVFRLPRLGTCEDPQDVYDYDCEIYKVLRQSEGETLPTRNCISDQPFVNSMMREMLVDWMQQLHFKFRMHTNTIYIAVNLLDRVLSHHVIPVEQFQLLGSACLYTAVKVEESHALSASQFVEFAANSFTEQDLRAMESCILQTVDHRLVFPTVCDFLIRYNTLLSSKGRVAYLSYYIGEFMLTLASPIGELPSHLAVLAIVLSRAIIGESPPLPDKLSRYADVTQSFIYPACRTIANNLRHSNPSLYIKRKFSTPEVEHISTVLIPETLPF